eukprot:TRINITY_DN6944_c1_g1_i1.p1 TRINITY_DN6944_c1_g1~~TRINITY_DN6944_c1_g1_i1.p1  ORF type:complete len:370 (+),score=72.17 TRINITY_DN6944_c1_g1_i1:50-1111(+)
MGQTGGQLVNVAEWVFPRVESSYDETHKLFVSFPSVAAPAVPALLLPPRALSSAPWHGPSPEAASNVGACVIYFHPNACDIGNSVNEMHTIRDGAFNGDAVVVAVEYAGYGLLSNYFPSVESIDILAEDAWQYCRKSLGFPGRRIVLWGRSIGTGPASQLARKRAARRKATAAGCRPIGGLVLIAPFTSLGDVVRLYSPSKAAAVVSPVVASMLKTYWSVDELVADDSMASVPLVVVHPEDDQLIPASLGRAVLDAASCSRKLGEFIADEDHNFCLRRCHLERARDFLAEVFAEAPATPSSPTSPCSAARSAEPADATPRRDVGRCSLRLRASQAEAGQAEGEVAADVDASTA